MKLLLLHDVYISIINHYDILKYVVCVCVCVCVSMYVSSGSITGGGGRKRYSSLSKTAVNMIQS